MSGTFHAGDIVLIKKFWNRINRNDIIKFSNPYQEKEDNRSYFVQRCIAIPGDCVLIENKKVFISKQELKPTWEQRHNYIIHADSGFAIEHFFDTLHISDAVQISRNNKYSCSLSEKEFQILKTKKGILKIDLRIEKKDVFDPRIFPQYDFYEWNADNYGPIYIPKKDDIIKLDTNSAKLYESIISRHENNLLEIKNGSVYINSKKDSIYTIKQNYYFVLGDNRDNAIDSRYWGLLPEKKIKGVVWFNIKKKKIDTN